VAATVVSPPDRAALLEAAAQYPQWIARGNGRSYGDAALGPCVINTLHLRRILHFDAMQGIVHCEAGVLLSDLVAFFVPQGWFFHVTPGTADITVGGAVASDVHGKNHFTKGCFSRWLLDFELLDGDLRVQHCSRTENAELFWQTCGGMGWTGIVLSARFQLAPLHNTRLHQKTVKAPCLEALFRAFETEMPAHEYAAAWIDCTAQGAAFGRGAAYFANADTDGQPALPDTYRLPRSVSVPFFAPHFLLNRLTIGAYNQALWLRTQNGTRRTTLHQWFYPLDSIAHWNRLYGRRGFVQYQFCVPEAQAPRAFEGVLHTAKRFGLVPFLSVMKRHGPRPSEALHSFPESGYSLALDFPRTSALLDCIPRFDALVWECGGKVYLTKDAASHPRMGRVNSESFGHPRCVSALRTRVRTTENT
jgi:FAD/FMN-containing dehydrogenase